MTDEGQIQLLQLAGLRGAPLADGIQQAEAQFVHRVRDFQQRFGLRVNPHAEMLVGGVEVERAFPGTTDIAVRMITDPAILDLRPSNIIGGVPYTNARFIRRSAYQRIGTYDDRFRVCADSEFLMRCYLAGVTAAVTQQPVYRFAAHPGSLTLSTPKGGSLAVATEVHEMVRCRLTEATTERERRAFRTWHSWIAPYRAGLLLAQRSPGPAAKIMLQAARTDPGFAVRTLPLIARHIWERQRRLGTLVEGPASHVHLG
jgi:hypothetical protein